MSDDTSWLVSGTTHYHRLQKRCYKSIGENNWEIWGLIDDDTQGWFTFHGTPDAYGLVEILWNDTPDSYLLGWPDIGWRGQVTWGSKTDWLECVMLPDKVLAVRKTNRVWHLPAILPEHHAEFRPLPTKEEQERIDIVDYVVEAVTNGNVRDSVESLYDLGMLRNGEKS